MDIDSGDIEHKAYDNYAFDSPPAADGTQGVQGPWTIWGTVNTPTRGTDFNQRIGRRIQMTHIDITGSWSPGTDLAIQGGYIRIMVVYDKQTNGAILANTSLFALDATFSPLNLDNRDRFEVICDYYSETVGAQQTFTPPSTTGLFVPNNFCVPICIHKELDHPTTYNANSFGDERDIETGGLWFCYSQAGFMEANPELDWYIRVRYTDY